MYMYIYASASASVSAHPLHSLDLYMYAYPLVSARVRNAHTGLGMCVCIHLFIYHHPYPPIDRFILPTNQPTTTPLHTQPSPPHASLTPLLLRRSNNSSSILDLVLGLGRGPLQRAVVAGDAGQLGDADAGEEEVDGGQQQVLGPDDEAPPRPDHARRRQRRVLRHRELLRRPREIRYPRYYERPFHHGGPVWRFVRKRLATVDRWTGKGGLHCLVLCCIVLDRGG